MVLVVVLVCHQQCGTTGRGLQERLVGHGSQGVKGEYAHRQADSRPGVQKPAPCTPLAPPGASSCYLLSRAIGRPVVAAVWPDKLAYFQVHMGGCSTGRSAEVQRPAGGSWHTGALHEWTSTGTWWWAAVGEQCLQYEKGQACTRRCGQPFIMAWASHSNLPASIPCTQSEVRSRRSSLLGYMLFLRLTPLLPNVFINLASPIVGVPLHTFALGEQVACVSEALCL